MVVEERIQRWSRAGWVYDGGWHPPLSRCADQAALILETGYESVLISKGNTRVEFRAVDDHT